jgi:hypothetical protein
MDDFDWLNNYIGLEAQIAEVPVATQPKKAVKQPKKQKGPWLTKFPPVERVAAMRVQFFDNGENPGKGKVQHTLKVRLYLDDGKPIRQHEPHWERVLELIDPKKVVVWATGERDTGNLTDQQFESYQTAKASLDKWLATDPDALWVKMGHISSPPGTHYFHGQFVAVTCTNDGDMTAIFRIEEEQIELDRFHRNNRARKKGAPVRHALYDPRRLITGTSDD